MTACLIKPTKALGYTDIYLDFIGGVESARVFYHAESLSDVASKLDNVKYDRGTVADILVAQNRLYGASDETFDNIAALSDPRAVCLLSGQQAGLFGGPMLTLVKAIALVKSARRYSKELDRPVLPVFWIAGDDHDLDEVNHVEVINRAGEMCSTTYKGKPEYELPLSEIYFSDEAELERVKESLKGCLGETDFTPELLETIDEAYGPDSTFVTAFGKLMARFTRGTGLIYFSPGDKQVKKLAAPFFRALLERQDELRSNLEKTNEKIRASGYHIQVEKKPESAHLFYNMNGRLPLIREGDSFRAGERLLSLDELLAEIDENPEKFSPDVMTRPLFQSYLFPTVAQLGGPAEIAYLAQMNSIFELFELPVPVHRARPSVTIVEKRMESLMREYDISFEDLSGDFEQTINRVMSKSFPHDIEKGFQSLRKDIQTRFNDFSQSMLAFDPSLRDFANQTFGKIDFSLKNFQGKLFSSHKKKSRETRERLYRIWHTLYPGRGFQERSLNISYFVARYGFDIVSFILEGMESEETSHQLLYMSEQKTV